MQNRHDSLIGTLSMGIPSVNLVALVSPSALEWFKSYLKGKCKCVHIGNVVSESLS